MGLFGPKLTKEEKEQKKADERQLKHEEKAKLDAERVIRDMNATQNGDWVSFYQNSEHVYFTPKEDSYGELKEIKFKANYIYVLRDGTALLENDPKRYNLIDLKWGENKIIKDKSVVGRAAAGALLAGPAGLLVGGLSGVGSKEVPENKAVITLQEQESHKVRTISFFCTHNQFQKYKRLPKVDLIEDENYFSTIQSESVDVSYLEQIKQLKELLDMDAITQEEYDKKKKQLLG